MAKKNAAQAESEQTETESQVADGEGGALFEDEEGSLVVDLNNVNEDGGFEVLPRGIYNCVIDDLQFGNSQRSGQPMFTAVLEVEDGDYQGRKLFSHWSFSPKALARTKRTLKRIAPQLLEGPFKPQEIADSGDLISVRCRARVDIRTYEGEKTNSVKDVMQPLEAGEGDQFLNG